MFAVGDLVTHGDSPGEHPPPRGRVVHYEGEAMGERMWLVAWKHRSRASSGSGVPERLLR